MKSFYTAKTRPQGGFFNFLVALFIAAFFVIFLGGITARKYIPRLTPSPSPSTFFKLASPSAIVTDPAGGVYPVNELLVSLIPGKTMADAVKVVDLVHGKVIGVVSSINLYQIEVPASTIAELESIMAILRTRTDLGIDGVSRDFLIPVE